MRKVAAYSLALTACDGILRIRGETPNNAECTVSLVDERTGHVANAFTVSGAFEKSVLFHGYWHAPDLVVNAECSGKFVSTVRHQSFHELDLGKLEP